jgi:hypothetical protein
MEDPTATPIVISIFLSRISASFNRSKLYLPLASHPDGSDVLGCVSDERQEDKTNESGYQKTSGD